ncbi:hypothetical protein P7K49_032402, partial [Saguinus oedipus]
MAAQPAPVLLLLLVLLLPVQSLSEPEATAPTPTLTLGSNSSVSRPLSSIELQARGQRPKLGPLFLLAPLAPLALRPTLL